MAGERPEFVRAFFGLPVSPAVRSELGIYLARCSQAASAFRWVAEGNLHLTVRFMGRVPRTVAAGIAEQLAVQHLSPFQIALGELGAFKRGRMARVVWIGMQTGADPARRLAAHVEAECVKAGLAADRRPLEPHLTLARARERDGAPAPVLPPVPPLEPWIAGELVLFESRLHPSGAVYEPLVKVTLDG